MNKQVSGNVQVLQPTKLLSYELVISEEGFFVSLNGDCLPTCCDGFAVDGNGSFLIQQGLTEVITHPIPASFAEQIMAADDVLFVHFVNGKEVDAKVLPRRDLVVKH